MGILEVAQLLFCSLCVWEYLRAQSKNSHWCYVLNSCSFITMKANQFLSPASWTIAFLFTFLGSTSYLQHFVISLLLFSSCKTSSLPLCIHFLLSSSWMFFAYCIFSTSSMFFSSSCIRVSFHNTHPSCRADSLMSSASLHYIAFFHKGYSKQFSEENSVTPDV